MLLRRSSSHPLLLLKQELLLPQLLLRLLPSKVLSLSLLLLKP